MSPADLRWFGVHSACRRDRLRAADATPTPIRSQKLPGVHKPIIACLNSVANVNPAVLIDRAERGLRKMVCVLCGNDRADLDAPSVAAGLAHSR